MSQQGSPPQVVPPQGSFDEACSVKGSPQSPLARRLSTWLTRSRGLYLANYKALYEARSEVLHDSPVPRLSTKLTGSQGLYKARLLQGPPQNPHTLRLSTRLACSKSFSDADAGSKTLHKSCPL